MPTKPTLSPTAATYTDEQLEGRDPHSPEDAADLVIEELTAGGGTSDQVDEKAKAAAREVEIEEATE